MSLSEDIYRELAHWSTNAVNPSHIVMAWDVVEALAAETPHGMRIGHDIWRVWGIPIIIGPTLPMGTWALGAEKPLDASRMVATMVAQTLRNSWIEHK